MLDVKKIAFNTAIMYVCLIAQTLVTLYMSRVILQALGVIDFGIFNVVSGVVLLMQFLNNTMSGSVQRYLSFELGKGRPENVTRFFNVAITVHLGIALLAFILGESAGFWFLRTYLNIPPDRMVTAESALHCVIAIFMCTVMTVPCTGLLNAKENMVAVSLLTLAGAVAKLAAAFALMAFEGDRLELYGVYLLLIAAATLITNYIICWSLYPEARLRLVREKRIYRELTGFAGWGLVGDLASIAKNQGTTILFNIFWGPAVNAANGIAAQISGQVQTFSTMLIGPTDPQIVKSYARGDKDSMFKLVFQTTKICFFVMYTVCLPLAFEMEWVLRLWLAQVPEYTPIFARLVLADGLVLMLSSLLPTVARATGKIAGFQLIVGLIIFINLPSAYLLLASGFPPYTVFLVSITVSCMALFARLLLLRPMVGLSLSAFVRQVLIRLAFLVMVTAVPMIALDQYIPDGLAHTAAIIFSAPALSVLAMWLFVLTAAERRYVIAGLGKLIARRRGDPARATS
ncbi:lipopolysaccharide biosynthesis protein [Methylolobus aquaticus]